MQDGHPPGTDDRAHRNDEMNTSCINRHRHAPLLSFNLQYTTRGVQMIVTQMGIDLAKSIFRYALFTRPASVRLTVRFDEPG